MSEELQFALSGDEQNALEVYEQTIARGLQTFVEVGQPF
jgi:hypothetical protein